MDIKNIYKQIVNDNNSFLLNLNIEDFYTSMLDFDPVTNESLYSNWDELLYNVSKYDFSKYSLFNDRFHNIVKFSEKAIYQIIDLLHKKNIREYKITNPNIIKDIDTKCMMWLSKKPGFNIKQKIAADKKMMGVFHKTSIDTAENRLFKAFLIKIDDIFVEKEKVLKKYHNNIKDSNGSIEDIEHLISKIHRWLYSEEAQLISNWNNVPPNNTLLNDRNYRKIWKSWNFLQHINDEIENDFNNKQYLLSEITFVLFLSKLNYDNRFQLKQDIVCPNYHINKDSKLTFFKENNNPIMKGYYLNNAQYKKLTFTLNNNLIKIQINNEIKGQLDITSKNIESFSQINDIVNTFLKEIFGGIKNNRIFNNQEGKEKQDLVAALDVNSILPEYVIEGKKTKQFTEKLICQSISNKKYNLPCNESKYIETKNNNYRTYSIHHIFNPELRKTLSDSKNKELLLQCEVAGNNFSKIISKVLNTNKCVYLVPDNIDDFSPIVKAFKRSMHTSFMEALLLPRSVASIFSNYEQILSKNHKGSEIKIEDIYDSYKIEIIYKVIEDKNLKNILPKTKGFVFERKSVDFQDIKSSFVVSENIKNIIYNKDIKLLNNKFSIDDFHFNNRTIENENYIGVFVNNSKVDSIVEGALKLYTLQKEVDLKNNTENMISLWKDYLPPLSIEKDDKSKFPLVGENVSINPFLNYSQPIQIEEKFELPENKPFYEFPLIQGEGKEKNKYFAYIKDSSFPLREPIKCRLKLTYTYGDEKPYKLEFIPIKESSFKSVSVNWEHESHRDLIHLPYPKYPEFISWINLKNLKEIDKKGTEKQVNYYEFAINSFNEIINKGTKAIITNISHRNPKRVCFLQNGIYCKFEIKTNNEINNEVWCYVNGKQGFYPLNLSLLNENNIEGQQLFKLKKIRKVVKTIWNDSRSIFDEDCPKELRETSKNLIDYLLQELKTNILPDIVEKEYYYILSIMSKDVPRDFLEKYTLNLISSDDMIKQNFDSISYLLDEAELSWQQEVLNKILLALENKGLRMFSIYILSKAVWRNRNFINKIPDDRIPILLESIKMILKNFVSMPSWKKKMFYSSALELLIALFRKRENKNNDYICELLSPSSNIKMKDLQDILNDLKDIVISNKKIKIKSFLRFEFDRTKNTDNVPDILYVADLYIDGKIESNSIKILNDVEEDA